MIFGDEMSVIKYCSYFFLHSNCAKCDLKENINWVIESSKLDFH